MVNKEQLEAALNGLEVDLMVTLPQKMKGQPIELQAMVNRMAQKTITGLRNIGNMSPEEILQTQTELNELQLKIKGYGTNVNK